MTAAPATNEVLFWDAEGNCVAVMLLFAEADSAGPFRVAPEEAAENGEVEIQIQESSAYEYEIINPGYRLRERQGVVCPSRVRSERDRGRITPGLNVGRLRLVLSGTDGQPAGSAEIEVRSVKATYRTDYRHMLEYIAGRCTDLLLELRSPAAQSVLPEDAREPATICQRFAFVRSLITSRRFRDAVQRVLAMPHRLWEQVEEEVPLNRGGRPSSSMARQIASASRRIPLPDNHPLHARITSVPERVTIFRNSETADTAENRFVKHALRSFQTFAAAVRERLNRYGRESDAWLVEEAEALEEEVGEILSRDFFRAVSEPQILPLGSPVLQRKGGYREILAVWLQFDMAARLAWQGGPDVYGAGKRDVATLYEYWLFFRLVEVIAKVFDWIPPLSSTLIETTDDGFGIRLKSGQHIAMEGEYTSHVGGRKLKFRYSYNRTFPRRGSAAECNFPAGGSWTERMRPDYTLTLWPAEFTEDEAERQEVIVHVHFDAKYRVEDIPAMFGQTDETFQNDEALEKDLSGEKSEQKQGRYTRADLLKMHAYKDAIRRTAGAYVLYPGTQHRNWRGFHEIIPGLGAFGIRPCDDGNDGTEALESFVRQVVQHVCDRATLREQESFHRYEVHEKPPAASMVRDTPEKWGGTRHPPPAETPVLVGWVADDAHLAWIRKVGLYNVRMDQRPGSLQLAPAMAGAKYLLLHGEGARAVDGLLEIASPGPRVFSRDELRKTGYPGKVESPFYLVYEIRRHVGFDKYGWNFKTLPHRPTGRQSAMPFTVTLSELMAVAGDPVGSRSAKAWKTNRSKR